MSISGMSENLAHPLFAFRLVWNMRQWVKRKMAKLKNKICVVSCLPALDNKFYSRALEIQRMPWRSNVAFS